ncbi:MAG: hypothetical protein JXQ75_04675 [Phycisphaerae bacterium]|nr:hypothetical protein [Phycisphaerae bacterium]
MARSNLVEYLLSGDWLETVLADFALSFTFFTALIYAALGRRLGSPRPAIAVSASLGAALSAGLVWWEQANGISIRNLGPVAVGFAVIVLAGVIYQSIRHVGGNWAGAGIALGACILVGWTVGIDWPGAPEIMQTIAGVALTVGILAFLMHRKGDVRHMHVPAAECDSVRNDISNLTEDCSTSDRLTRGFRHLRQEAGTLYERPQEAEDIMLQLRRMLPAEGWLTNRMAGLRTKAHFFRRGHIARIDELRGIIGKLPPPAKAKVAKELAARFKELNVDARIERLDRLVAATERRVRDLTQEAETLLAKHDFQKLVDVLKAAEKAQHHCSKLIALIGRTEKKLFDAAAAAAQQAAEVNHE